MTVVITVITAGDLHRTGHAIGGHRTGDEVNHAAHGLRAIQNLTRAFEHFNALDTLDGCGVMR